MMKSKLNVTFEFNKKDEQYLDKVLAQFLDNLEENGIKVEHQYQKPEDLTMTEWITYSRESGFNIVEATDEQSAEMLSAGIALDPVSEFLRLVKECAEDETITEKEVILQFVRYCNTQEKILNNSRLGKKQEEQK